MIIQVDDNPQEYTFRSSGLCICTGSGSRSWFRAMNFPGRETIQAIVALATNSTLHLNDKQADLLVHKYLDLYAFDPGKKLNKWKFKFNIISVIKKMNNKLFFRRAENCVQDSGIISSKHFAKT